MPTTAESPPDRRGRLRRLYATWLPLVFGATAMVNLVLTGFVPPSSRPIEFHDEASLTHLVHTEQPSVDRRYSFYLELDDATDGGTLIVPPDSFVVAELADGFADFEVTELDYDPTSALPDGLEDTAAIGVVETEEGDLSYSIVSGEDDVWWLAFDNEGVVVVPESAAPVPEAAP